MFDANVKVGPWPYRPVQGLAALLQGMDACGIERAAVSSLSAVHFLNPQDGNDELASRIQSHRDRLVPFAVIRPNFTGWLDDLKVCIKQYGMAGVVLYPNYHAFELSEASLAPLMVEAAAHSLAVCVQTGLEDPRRQFRPYKIPEVAPESVGAFARTYPDVPIIALGLKFGQPELVGGPWPSNLYFDTSNYEAMGELEHAVATFGSARMLFGSNFPLFNLRANVDKLRHAPIPETDRRAIAGDNLRRILAHSSEIAGS